uniref:C-type lectin domain-containing protein n=1 Tax=Sinocyclocheilus grahami TaxID=75366 RepID=A0A672RDU6_SINGR
MRETLLREVDITLEKATQLCVAAETAKTQIKKMHKEDHNNSHVFYFIPDNMNWTSAQTYCRQHHTDLATVDDWTDYDELLNTLPKGFTEYIWIGLYQNNAAAPWVWSDSSKSTFSSWDVRQPYNYDGEQLCAAVCPAENWHNLECAIKYASVCYMGVFYILQFETLHFTVYQTAQLVNVCQA